MSIRISTHAVERIDSAASWNSVKEILSVALMTAARAKRKTFAGDTVYVAEGFRMVVAEENGHREVLTVLPPFDNPEEAVPDLALQLAAEFQEWEKTQQAAKGTSPKKAESAITVVPVAAKQEKKPKKTRGAVKHDLEVAQAQLAKMERRLAKQAAHAQRMCDDRDAAKGALKAVLGRVIEGDLGGALAVADAEVPGLMSWLRSQGAGEK